MLLKLRPDEYELGQIKSKIEEKKKLTKAQHHLLQSSTHDHLKILPSILEKMDAMDKKVNRLEYTVRREKEEAEEESEVEEEAMYSKTSRDIKQGAGVQNA